MKKYVKFGYLFLLSLLLVIIFSMNSFEAKVQTEMDTRVGIGFDEVNSTEQIQDSSFNPFEEPKDNQPAISNKLPQLGQLIEPMIVVLLGLLIWLVVLSLIAVRRYLKKEGEA